MPQLLRDITIVRNRGMGSEMLADAWNESISEVSKKSFVDRNCKNKYIREEELIEELLKIIDKVNINELGMRQKL